MRRVRRAGFTIIEILIAIVVLVLGITGIVALFPTAIESGNKTVEDTYSATITQSVVDAISVGLRESRYTWTAGASFGAGAGRSWTYFVFNHDGVLDKPPQQPEAFENGGAAGDKDEVWNKDYCVILPQSPMADNVQADQEPFFVFPVPHVDSSTKGDALNKDQRMPEKLGGMIVYDNFKTPDPTLDRVTAEGTKALWFTRVYQLGRQRNMGTTPPGDVGKIRPEYRAEDISTGGTTGDENIAVDPYPTYSFAFAIKRARIDSNADGVINATDRFSSSLYEVRIYVFKNFSTSAAQALAQPESGGTSLFPPVPKTNVPLRTFITLISL